MAPLPADLLEAVSAPGGGRIALIVGAGCSCEYPTNIPTAQACSTEVHRCLLDDGVLRDGDCANPSDLSSVTDAVVAKGHSQGEVVRRLSDRFPLKLPTPNDGHLIAAALLGEGAVVAIVTLNFDLALSVALSQLGVGSNVGVIEGPEDLPKQRTVNVYYLHGNANSADPDSWILQSAALETAWRDTWQPIIATRVLISPVIVFAGLGTPVTVLLESTRLIRASVQGATNVYQVDTAAVGDSRFYRELGIGPAQYIRAGWCEFMDELSRRLVRAQVAQLEDATRRKTQEDAIPGEDVTGLLSSLEALGLVRLGFLRAEWLLHDRRYAPCGPDAPQLVADLLLALAMLTRVSGAVAKIVDEGGLVEFRRGDRLVASFVVASGRGHRGKMAVEALVESRRSRYRGRSAPLRGVIVGGTSGNWTQEPTLPLDIAHEEIPQSILSASSPLPMFHVAELRARPELVREVVP